MGLFGPPNIEKMKAKKNVKGLIKVLNYPKDYRVRNKAVKALGYIGDPQAVEPLIEVLKYEEHDLSMAAVDALGRIGNHHAIVSLHNILRQVVNSGSPSDLKLGNEIVRKLSQIDDSEVVEPLIMALERGSRLSEFSTMGRIAAKALGEIGSPRAIGALILNLKEIQFISDALHDMTRAGQWSSDNNEKKRSIGILKDQISKALIRIGEPAVKPLICALKEPFSNGDSDKGRRVYRLFLSNVFLILSKIGGAAIEQLILATRDNDCAVRMEAVMRLGDTGDARFVELLIALLKDKDQGVRAAAVRALGDIDDARAVEPLIVALRDENSILRADAVRALDKLGWEPDCGEDGAWYWVLKELYFRHDTNSNQVVEIGVPAVEPLIAIFQKEKYETIGVKAVRSIEALVRIGDPRAIEPFVLSLWDVKIKCDLIRRIIDALDSLGWEPDQGEDGAWYWLRKKDWNQILTLGSIAIGPLLTYLTIIKHDRYWNEEEWNDKIKKATEMLDQLGWKPNSGESAAWYWVVKGEWQKAIALGSPAIESLSAVLNLSGDSRLLIEMRKAAADALSNITDPIAVEALIDALKPFKLSMSSKDYPVRKAICGALVKSYQDGNLHSQSKKNILAVRDMITDKHIDIFNPEQLCIRPGEQAPHTDAEIGVDFPL